MFTGGSLVIVMFELWWRGAAGCPVGLDAAHSSANIHTTNCFDTSTAFHQHTLVHCCSAAGVRVGCYANGFKTTTSQWLTGSSDGLVQSASGAFPLPDDLAAGHLGS
jgi:hypothetical protein